MAIHQAIIMAAGNATRMRPLTDHIPKPLLKIHGKPLLTYIIDHLVAENVTKIVINGYHAIEPLREYIDYISTFYTNCEFILSEETDLLETGGGLINALSYLDKNDPFFMINGDAHWINHPHSRSLKNLSNHWQVTKQGLVLLLQPCSSMAKTTPIGDYDLSKDGMATRSHDQIGEYMFTGVRICHPKILKNYEIEKFSFLRVMDAQDHLDDLGGIVHHGQWYHISTPEDLHEVNQVYNTQ